MLLDMTGKHKSDKDDQLQPLRLHPRGKQIYSKEKKSKNDIKDDNFLLRSVLFYSTERLMGTFSLTVCPL